MPWLEKKKLNKTYLFGSAAAGDALLLLLLYGKNPCAETPGRLFKFFPDDRRRVTFNPTANDYDIFADV